MEQLGGRKFFLTCAGVFLVFVIPIIYKKMEIPDSITQVVIAAIAAGVGAYGAMNVLQDKVLAQSKDNKKEDNL